MGVGHWRLEQIAEREAARGGILLVDTNVVCGELLWETYHCKQYRDLNPDTLRKADRHLRRMRAFIKRSNVYTIASVVEELRNGFDLMRERLQYWNEKKPRKGTPHPDEATTKLRKAMEDLEYQELHLNKSVRHAVYQPKHPAAYGIMAQMVIDIERALRITHKRSPSVDLCTDEQLAAMALYIPLVEGKRATVITRDHDLPKLLATATLTFTTTSLVPGAVIEQLDMRGPEVYFPWKPQRRMYALRDYEWMVRLTLRDETIAQMPYTCVEHLSATLAYQGRMLANQVPQPKIPTPASA